ncbi:MAG: TetR/AcrR family transcriptional regulator [Acidimicrobiia bacterium]|jgi:AcrR family transcriptional regulator
MVTAIGRRPETRRSRQTRQALVEAARTVVRRTGSLSPEAVATEAGVAPATFYLHFANKDEALAATFDAVLEELHATTTAALDLERLLADGLERVVQDLARNVVKGFRRDAGVVRLAISRLPEARPVQEVYREREDATLTMLTAFVRSGARAGMVRAGDPGRIASALLVSVQGYQNPLLLQPGTSAVLDELVAMLLALLRPE